VFKLPIHEWIIDSDLKPGIGLSAKSVEQGGSDLIIIYNSGRFRMAGRGSLAGLMPYSDANAVVVDMVWLNTMYPRCASSNRWMM
jgi:predicted TIM-barrel enzyme